MTSTPIKKLARILLFVIGGIVLLIIIGLALAPSIAKGYVNKNSKELIGRQVHIDKLNINYFKARVRVAGFKVFEQNEKDVFFAFDLLEVDAKIAPIFDDELFIQRFNFVNPTGVIIHNDSIFNFSDLITSSSKDSLYRKDTLEVKSEPSKKKLRLNLNNISITKANFSYTDVQIDNTISIDDLSLKIPQIYWNQTDSSKADLAFDLSSGGRFESSMSYLVRNGNFSGNISIVGLDLATFLPYAQEKVDLQDLKGKFTTHLEFDGNINNWQLFRIKGDLMVDSLALIDMQQKTVFSFEKYAIDVSNAWPMQQNFAINRIELNEPYVYFEMFDSTNNLSQLSISGTEDTVKMDRESKTVDNPKIVNADSSAIDSSQLYIEIDRLLIQNGHIDFYDKTMPEEFYYNLSEVTVDMDTLTINDDWVNVNASMLLNKRGRMEVQLGVNPFQPMERLDLNYVISDFQLTDLNIYSKHYAGLPILLGDMYYHGNTQIDHKQMDSQNELVFRNVEMGRKAGGIYDLPIKAAIYLLKDKNGDVTLDVPVKGDLSDPNVSISKIVGNTLKNLVVKVVASPFQLLGNATGLSPQDMEKITFDYEQEHLTSNQEKVINELLKLEEEKPEIQINLKYVNDWDLEKANAAKEIVRQQYLDKKKITSVSNLKDYQKYLEKRTGKTGLVIQDYELLLADPTDIEALIEKREHQRIEMVKAYLAEHAPNSKIKGIPYNADEMMNHGSRPSLLISYDVFDPDSDTN